MKLIFFHNNCVDGTMSAAVASLKYPNSDCVELNYGPECLNTIKDNIEKRLNNSDNRLYNIMFVDFDLSTEILDYLYDECYNKLKEMMIEVIDHHKTFYENFKKSKLYNSFKNDIKIKSNKFNLSFGNTKSSKLNNLFNITYDENKSGATLTYQYLFPNKKLPKILKHVEDRDLWLNKLQPNTEYIHIILSSKYLNKPYMVNIDKLLELNTKQLNQIVEQGKNSSEYKNNLVANIVEEWNKKRTFFTIIEKTYERKERVIPAINSNIFQSEIGNMLLFEEYDLCCIYSVNVFKRKATLSFRSKDGSAKKFAEWFGGGGHDNAAGAVINMRNFYGYCNLDKGED